MKGEELADLIFKCGLDIQKIAEKKKYSPQILMATFVSIMSMFYDKNGQGFERLKADVCKGIDRYQDIK